MTVTTAAKSRPIIMSADSVSAIPDDRKTQTRRVVKPQPIEIITDGEGGWVGYEDMGAPWLGIRCPYGVPGDLLWVRETWRPFCGDDPRIEYRAGGVISTDDAYMAAMSLKDAEIELSGGTVTRWRSPMFMPKEFARLWLRVVKVRVERVQEISGPDALCEGVLGIGEPTVAQCDGRWAAACAEDAKRAFSMTWDSLNAKPKPVYEMDGRFIRRDENDRPVIDYYVSYPWQLDGGITEREYRNRKWMIYPNPWVWVVEFERTEKPA